MMHFVKITDTAPVADFVAKTLAEHLAKGERVLWLVPGGSSIAIAAAASRQLREQTELDLSNLTVTLTDERYGELDHPDSNWRQLAGHGFDLPGAMLLPVLTGVSMAATVEEFAAVLKNHLGSADYRLGFFGIGADGHTAGMLPGSPAVASSEFAVGYDAATLGAAPYKRLTMTAPAIARLDEAVVYATGEPKWPVIDQLATEDVPLPEQPAQILKTVPKLTIFNDHRGQ